MDLIRWLDLGIKLIIKVDHILGFLYSKKSNCNIHLMRIDRSSGIL